MIAIGETQGEVPAEAAWAPGGFAWWYADLCTPQGDGVVLIWAYGLPFLPGLAHAARRGHPQRAADRPSVNLVVYRGGAPVFYLLQEHGGDAPGLAALQDVGASRFRRVVSDGRCRLYAELDCAVPGTDARVTGTLSLDCALRTGPAVSVADDGRHVWTPMTGPGEGEARLDFGGAPLARIRGRAYHDRNHGTVPLHALGIDRWIWGRAPLPGREAVWYLLWPHGGGEPTALGFETGKDGEMRGLDLSVDLSAPRRAAVGLRYPGEMRLRTADGAPWLTVRHARVADDGPFYLRLLAESEAPDGARAAGWGELCVPDRVDLSAHRPLVRMRVHRTAGGNSLWLPLFTGPREGRLARLVRHALRGAP